MSSVIGRKFELRRRRDWFVRILVDLGNGCLIEKSRNPSGNSIFICELDC